MVVVAILTVRKSEIASFRLFEGAAAVVMREHGAALERSVVIGANDASDVLTEVHFVRFPDAAAFEAYRRSSALDGMRHLRDAAVVETQLLIGEDGPEY